MALSITSNFRRVTIDDDDDGEEFANIEQDLKPFFVKVDAKFCTFNECHLQHFEKVHFLHLINLWVKYT